ncbi:MAG: tRNA (adenosine(37)-N6)-threonylcarbamoyltransferase complex ATPase subunit type 1 TsaE [bacterium]
MEHISRSQAETRAIAEKFLNTLNHRGKASVVALQGDLGAGKTSFAQAIGLHLGIKESMQSPTFVIMKVYKINFKNFKKLIHIDAYRLEKEKELLHLGWEEMIREPENLILIEWPENVKGIIPSEAKLINLEFVDENTRKIEWNKE